MSFHMFKGPLYIFVVCFPLKGYISCTFVVVVIHLQFSRTVALIDTRQ